MKKFINVTAVQQTGENCKITAIAAVDKYFAEKISFEPIPLHKNKAVPISMRQLSKTRGSFQGELLEVRQFTEIFGDLGYETELIDFQDHYDLFKEKLTNNIKSGHLVIACFAVERLYGLPSTHYNHERDNEHAAILHGFNDETEELNMTHWGEHRKTTMKDFYNSSMVLLKERKPEYYVNVKHVNKDKKYDLRSEATINSCFAKYFKSLIPTANSGFRGKLLVIKQPERNNIVEVRKKLLNTVMPPELKLKMDELKKLFTELKLKTDELINKGNKKSKYRYRYREVAGIATQLNIDLEDAKMEFLTHQNLAVFKEKCNTAIIKAEPEFKKHRGWHKVPLILRRILGVLAALTIIPWIVVAAGVTQGYIGTFFKTPKTESEEKLELFKKKINNLR